jgi:serine/threonine protein kinase
MDIEKTFGSKGYKIISVCGEGVFGKVYCVQNTIGEKKCVKVIPVDKFDEKEWETTFQVLRNCNCPHIIVYSNKIPTNCYVLLEMEYMDRGDLKTFIDNDKSQLSTELILNIVKQIRFFFYFYFIFNSNRCLKY